MKTSFKKAMKCLLKSVPGISYLTHKGHLSGPFCPRGFYPSGFCHRGFCPRGFCHRVFCPEGLCPNIKFLCWTGQKE